MQHTHIRFLFGTVLLFVAATLFGCSSGSNQGASGDTLTEMQLSDGDKSRDKQHGQDNINSHEEGPFMLAETRTPEIGNDHPPNIVAIAPGDCKQAIKMFIRPTGLRPELARLRQPCLRRQVFPTNVRRRAKADRPPRLRR